LENVTTLKVYLTWEVFASAILGHGPELPAHGTPVEIAVLEACATGRLWVTLGCVKRKANKKRKSPDGISTNKLVFSACQGTNNDVFPSILTLYVPRGSKVADITFGRGVFWKNVPKDDYHVLPTDLKTGVDCRALPYENSSLECVVFDPPYMHTPGGTAHVNHQNYENYYANNIAPNGSGKKYHEAVLDLYFKTAHEAKRVLKPEGIFIVKCGDEVCANQQRLTHVELINEFAIYGFIVEDLFVLVRNNRPGVSRILRQVHARKNHSYFLVFRKSNAKRVSNVGRITELPEAAAVPQVLHQMA
jgi:DNA methylase